MVRGLPDQLRSARNELQVRGPADQNWAVPDRKHNRAVSLISVYSRLIRPTEDPVEELDHRLQLPAALPAQDTPEPEKTGSLVLTSGSIEAESLGLKI